MKTLRVLTFIFSILFVNACSKSDLEGLNGKWKLTEQLADPGDGSGKWMRSEAKNSYIIFNADGTVSGNLYVNYKFYNVIDSTKIEFTLQDDTKRVLFYKLSGGSLEIMGACIEACGSRFRKEN